MCVSAFAGGREMLNYSRRRVLPGAIVRERERERERERGLIFTVQMVQEAEMTEIMLEMETIDLE